MAFREIRIYFHSLVPGKAKELNLSIGGPFEWYMDGVMRGCFKEYSGNEVKGINIVNLCLYSPDYVETMRVNSGHGLQAGWLNLLNTYQYELELELDLFDGDQQESIIKSIESFIEHASLLDIPAMNTLVEHVKESLGVNSIEHAVARAAKEMEKIMQYVSKNI